MIALIFYLQLSLASGINRPVILDTSNEENFKPHDSIRNTDTNIDIQDCLFDKMDVKEENGGAILITGKYRVNCTVNHCKFNECKAKNGSAIYTYYAKNISYEINVIDSIFTSCEAQNGGGAIYIQGTQPLLHKFEINGCTFTNNKALYGGALYAEIRDQLNLENCRFENNEAKKGSSGYFVLGHENIKTNVPEHDTFKFQKNTFIFSPKINNTVSVYIENDGIEDADDVPHTNVNFGGCTFNIGSSKPEIEDYLHLEIVENIEGFESFDFDSCNCVHQAQSTVQIASNINFKNFNFGCTSSDACQPNIIPTPPPPTPDLDGYTPRQPIREITTNIRLEKCKFSSLVNLEGNGGAILITYAKRVSCYLTDCLFTECKAINGGAIHVQYSKKVEFRFILKTIVFNRCEAKGSGGAIYAQSAQPSFHVFNITECTFNNNKAVYGGGLYAELRDQLNLENCQFNNNEASNKGSSAYLKLGHENIGSTEHDNFNIHNNVFVFSPTQENTINVYIENDQIEDKNDPPHANVYLGGCTFNIEGSPAIEDYLHLKIDENTGSFESFNFDSCNCVHQGEKTVIFNVTSNSNFYNFHFSCTSIDQCTSDQPIVPVTKPPTPDSEGFTPHDPIRETNINIDIKDCLFDKLDNLENNGGAISIPTTRKVNCAVNHCKFNQCKAKNGGAIYAYYSKRDEIYKFIIINSIFDGCEATENGGAVYIRSAQPVNHTFNINGCTFNNNKAVYGGGLYAELRDQLILENCQFNNNEASNQGSSAYFKLGHENTRSDYEEHDTFYIHKNTFIFNPKTGNTINVYIENDAIADEKDPSHANVYLGGCTFNIGSSTPTINKYLHLKVVENKGSFESFNFDSCSCVHQGEKTVEIASTLTLSNFKFDCTSIDTCPPSEIIPTPPPTSGYQKHDPIRETTINIDIRDCLFDKLDNLENNGGAILITTKKRVNCTVNHCLFNECKAKMGGAIDAFYSSTDDYEFNIINSIFNGCEAAERGGAIYIQSGQPSHHTFHINKCTFNNNKAKYGGGLYAELRDQLNLENSQFNNNEASNKGSSAYFRLGFENLKKGVEEHDTFYIHKNTFIFNPKDSNTINVYVENDGITDANDPAHVNVYFGGCTFNIGSSAPSVFDYHHLKVVANQGGFESFTFDSCNCVHQGKKTVEIPSEIALYNFNFGCTSIDKCTSDQPSIVPTEPPTADVDGYTPHTPIRETSTTIDVEKSKFNGVGNLDQNGGAIFISYSNKVNCNVNDCKFNECKGNNGGAIHAQYSLTTDYAFRISQTSFSGCQANSRGGSIYVQSSQPLHHNFVIKECTFDNNKAEYGGGLYAELRDQLNLENCQFKNNKASNKGSSVYLKAGHENIKNTVEEHDTFKIHKNTFIFNPDINNTVNVFIENDGITDPNDTAHANVYFGGCTFAVENSGVAQSESSSNDYYHLEIVENKGGFESFNFDSCICVKEGQNTVKLLPDQNYDYFNFECTSIDKCTSVADKGIGSGSSGKNKSKVGMAVGIAVGVVVVVAIVVVVVIFVIRKKSNGNYVGDVKSDDENLNAGSSVNNINDQDGAL